MVEGNIGIVTIKFFTDFFFGINDFHGSFFFDIHNNQKIQ